MSKVLITGAGGGFGRLIVRTLRDKGHDVVGTMRDVNGRNADVAQTISGLGAKVVEMDVTDDASVEAGIAEAIDAAGGLDVVINNAGVGTVGVQESFTADDWRRIFEVNVFGAHRVVRAATPTLRAQRSGLVIQVSSLLGRMIIPYYGPYNASKWALEAMSENYRVELSAFGVDVVVVEPGGFATDFIPNLVRPSDATRDDALDGMPQDAQAFLEGFEKALAANDEQDAQLVADAVLGLVEAKPGERPFRTVVDTLGMGAALEPYNAQLEQIQSNVFSVLGLGHLRELKAS